MKTSQTLRFWWIPQVPMKPFRVSVKTVEEAKLLYNAFAAYDKFQLDNRIKGDYCNVGGLEVEVDNEDGEKDWEEWTDEDGNDINHLLRK